MQILALTNLYPSPWQPDRAPFNRQQLRGLANRHAVRVIAPIAWTDEILLRWKGAAGMPSGRQAVLDGIQIEHPRYLFPPKILRASYGRCFLASVRGRFDRILGDFQPELVYGTWAYPDGWAAVELGHRAGLPVVIRVHGSDINLIDKHPSRRRATREALERADAVIAPSANLAQGVISLGANAARTHVVNNGVDTHIFHPGSRSDARVRLGLSPIMPVVLFIGNLVPVKGIDLLIDACAKLISDKVQFLCYIIGQGPLKSRLERQIRDRKAADCIKLPGPKPHDALADWYRAANVVVLPSHSEGMPNVLLEAAACGTRFVASRVGGIPEIVKDGNGHLVSPGDVVGLAQAIGEALDDSAAGSLEPKSPPRTFDDSASELASILEHVFKTHRLGNPNAIEAGAMLSVGSK